MDPSHAAADSWDWYSLLVPVAALAVNVAAQILLVRLRGGTHFLRSVVEGCGWGAFALAALELFRLSHQGFAGEPLAACLLVNCPAYLALSYCYFNFINLGQSSIRIRIYEKIASTPGGLALEDLAREYNEQSLLEMRLHRLRESGDLLDKEGVFYVGRARLVRIAHLIFTIKQFVLGKASEFE